MLERESESVIRQSRQTGGWLQMETHLRHRAASPALARPFFILISLSPHLTTLRVEVGRLKVQTSLPTGCFSRHLAASCHRPLTAMARQTPTPPANLQRRPPSILCPSRNSFTASYIWLLHAVNVRSKLNTHLIPHGSVKLPGSCQ